MERKAVNQREAAEALGVHPHTLRRLIAEGRIDVVRVGRRVLVPVAEIERFLEPQSA
jgi:excisionase family DNA binding protein